MVRIARERISTLFALAEREAAKGHRELADRYVTIARRVGTRYNVRLMHEYRDLYCRGCSAFWVEGRTVRTRLRSGRRVRTCLRCGRERRTLLRSPSGQRPRGTDADTPPISRIDAVLGEVPNDEAAGDLPDDESEEN
jgi:ribonuclease P protein subunit RPR2